MNREDTQDRLNSLDMPRGSTLRIDEGAGSLLHVWEGELWLTEEGGRDDHILREGQWFRVSRGGAALAHAFQRSLVSVTPAAPEQAAQRVALLTAGSEAPTVLYQREGFSFVGLLRGLQALRAAWQALAVRASAIS
jgi:Protein of unknown function (DUF2917)